MVSGAFLLLTLLTPTTTAAATAPVEQVEVEAASAASAEEVGFFEEYFPLSLNDDLHPATDSLMLPFWLSHLFLPFGWLWAPYVFGDARPGGSFPLDAFLIMVAHVFASGACLAPCVIVPVIGWALGLVLGIWAIVNWAYLTPVAVLNAYDRSVKNAPAGERGDCPEPDRSPEDRRQYKRRPFEPACASRPAPQMAF